MLDIGPLKFLTTEHERNRHPLCRAEFSKPFIMSDHTIITL